MKTILFAIALLIPVAAFAQQYDNTWVLGSAYSFDPMDSIWGRTIIDFSSGQPEAYYDGWEGIKFRETNGTMSNAAGELLFYTNGLKIANSDNQIMDGNTIINPGEIADDYDAYFLNQSAFGIPHLSDTTLYYLVHMNREYPTFPDGDLGSHSSKLYYTLIDISENNGLGKVIEENIEVLSDTLNPGKITAVKHANGRDWWMIVFEYDSSSYYRILIDPDGFHVLSKEVLSPIQKPGVGGSVFSPDGSKFVHYCIYSITQGNYLTIYDFDRCTGYLSNPIMDNFIDAPADGGVAISSNSRVLYVSSTSYLYQYDLFADDIFATKDTVAIYDGYSSPNPTTFYNPQLAPDGKIYINTTSTSNALHIIHSPDELGDACNVEQHGFTLPTYNIKNMPNFPNYRLGALEGSPCDSLTVTTTDLEVIESDIRLFPNPNSGLFYLETPEGFGEEAQLEVYNSSGKMVKTIPLQEWKREIEVNLTPLTNGLYFIRILQNGQPVLTKRVLVNR